MISGYKVHQNFLARKDMALNLGRIGLVMGPEVAKRSDGAMMDSAGDCRPPSPQKVIGGVKSAGFRALPLLVSLPQICPSSGCGKYLPAGCDGIMEHGSP